MNIVSLIVFEDGAGHFDGDSLVGEKESQLALHLSISDTKITPASTTNNRGFLRSRSNECEAIEFA